MAIETTLPHSRRALLAAGLGGLVAAVAAALGRPATVTASHGDVHLGGYNAETVATEISNTMSAGGGSTLGSALILRGVDLANATLHTSNSGSGRALFASTNSVSQAAVTSNSGAGLALDAWGYQGTALRGWSRPPSGNKTGVIGVSGEVTPPAAPDKTGVYGYAAQDGNSRGVTGKSTAGRGVYGEATSGTGLFGLATTGYALRTNGRVRLENSSGQAIIATGTRSITVTPGPDLTTSSTVLATLQASAGGTTTVHRVVVNATTNRFTIHLTADSTVDVRVGWILLS